MNIKSSCSTIRWQLFRQADGARPWNRPSSNEREKHCDLHGATATVAVARPHLSDHCCGDCYRTAAIVKSKYVRRRVGFSAGGFASGRGGGKERAEGAAGQERFHGKLPRVLPGALGSAATLPAGQRVGGSPPGCQRSPIADNFPSRSDRHGGVGQVPLRD